MLLFCSAERILRSVHLKLNEPSFCPFLSLPVGRVKGEHFVTLSASEATKRSFGTALDVGHGRSVWFHEGYCGGIASMAHDTHGAQVLCLETADEKTFKPFQLVFARNAESKSKARLDLITKFCLAGNDLIRFMSRSYIDTG